MLKVEFCFYQKWDSTITTILSMEELAKILTDSFKALRDNSNKSDVSTVLIPVFDPSSEDGGASKWIDEVEELGETFNWTEYELLVRGSSGLVGEAKEWYAKWKPGTKSWQNFKTDICELYPAKRNLSEKFRRASLYTSKDANTYCEYARHKIVLINSLNFRLTSEQLLQIVIGDIADIHVKTAAFNSKIGSVSELMVLLENYTMSTEIFTEKSLTKRKYPSEFRTERQNFSELCYTCDRPGHISRFCPKKRNSAPSYEVPPVNKSFDKSRVVCVYCKKRGHYAVDCFKNKHRPSTSHINYFSTNLDSDFCTEFFVQGLTIRCLIDTGAGCSLISEKIVKKLNCHLEPALINLKGIGSSTIFANSKTTLRIENNGTGFEICFFVVDNSIMDHDAILGRNFFVHKGLELQTDYTGSRLILKDCLNFPSETLHHVALTSDLINTSLSGNDLQNLINLLSKYAKIISTGYAVSPITTAEMSIKLTEDKIINFHPYRMALCEREKVKDIVHELLKNNIIRESTSAYASPIVLVHKKNGSGRLCVDYRALNKITVKDRYPLPLIQDQIDNLRHNKYYCSLDMASGFYQIPIAQDSIEKTAFVTPDGHYEYLRVPMGLSNAPAVFQRAICKALGNLKDKDALVYLDDVLIPSKSISEGLVKLDKVLKALSTAGFTLNRKKCYFFETKIEYLGQEISEHGIRPSKNKVEALLNASDPKTVKQVRQFMGLANYFRKYIPELSARTACITKLTKNNEKFVWGDDQKIAKEYVCAFLSQRPLLSFF